MQDDYLFSAEVNSGQSVEVPPEANNSPTTSSVEWASLIQSFGFIEDINDLLYRQVTSLIDVILKLRKENGISDVLDNNDSALCDESSKVYIDVRRKYVLKDAFRECNKKFDPKKLLRVWMI